MYQLRVRYSVFILWLVCQPVLFAQVSGTPENGIAGALHASEQVSSYSEVPVFSTDRSGQTPDLSADLRHVTFLRADQNALDHVIRTRPELIRLPVPSPEGFVLLELYRVEIHAAAYRVRTSDGPVRTPATSAVFYRGMVAGDSGSIAAVSFLGEEVHIMYSGLSGDHRIHRVSDNLYAFYRDRDIRHQKPFRCDVTDSEVFHGVSDQIEHRTVQTGNCVEVYFECEIGRAHV